MIYEPLLRTILPPLPVVLPLVGAALLSAVRGFSSRRVMDVVAIVTAALHVAFCAVLLRMATRNTLVYWFGNWFPRGADGHTVLGIGFVVDPLAAGLALLAGVLFLLAFVFSWRQVESGARHFHPLMLVFLAAMSGFVLTGDLFNLFVWFELMSTAAFALCGLKTSEPAPLQGSFNFAVTNTVAAFLGLTGLSLLYSVTGALNMGQIGLLLSTQAGGPRHDPLLLFAFTLLVCCFFIKAAIFPFHLWLPDAHAVAPTPVCVLFSGLMVELGLYAVARLHTVIFAAGLAAHAGALRGILLLFAGLTVGVGGVMCYAEHHLKRILAFSTVCHAGLMLAALSVQGAVASAAFFTYVFAHAFLKAALFFTAGIVLHRLRSMSEQLLWQRRRVLRWTGVVWMLGGLGLAGVPPFGTWLSVALVEGAAKEAGVPGLGWLFVVGEALTAAAVFRVGLHVFVGLGSAPLTDEAASVDELPETGEENRLVQPYHFVPALVCVLLAVSVGVWPPFRGWMADAAARFADQPGYWRTLFTGATVQPVIPSLLMRPVTTNQDAAAFHGILAAVLGMGLALSSVYRHRLPKRLRLGAVLETRLQTLRSMQSGHPGDYVLWLTVGVAVMGLLNVLLLRR